MSDTIRPIAEERLFAESYARVLPQLEQIALDALGDVGAEDQRGNLDLRPGVCRVGV